MSTAENPHFGQHIQEVHAIFKKYSSYSDRQEHENAGTAKDEIDAILQTVQAQATTHEASFSAKQNAIGVVVEIARAVINESDPSILGHDLRDDLVWLPVASSISAILDTLLPEELAALQADGEMAQKLRGLRYSAGQYSLDIGLSESIDKLYLEDSDAEDDTLSKWDEWLPRSLGRNA